MKIHRKTKFYNNYLASKTFITTSVIKNGNVFSLHLTDPKKDKPEAEIAHSSSTSMLAKSDDSFIAKYGCFTGSFKDGFNISFSVYDIKPSFKSKINYFEMYGNSLEKKLFIKVDANVQMIAPVQEQVVAPPPPPLTAADKKNDKKKGKKEPTPEPPPVVNIF